MKKTTLLLISTVFALSACTTSESVNTPSPNASNAPADTSTPAADAPADGYDAENGLNEAKTELLDRRDQQKYAVTQIGDAYWMAQDLKFETEQSRTSEVAGAGRVYYWSDAQNVCPAGWHLPSDAEWQTLEQELGMTAEESESASGFRGVEAAVGDKLKSSSGWFEGKNGNNSSGFNAVPGGVFDSVFAYTGEETHYWSATEYMNPNENLEEAWSRRLSYESSGIERKNSLQGLGFFVRCVAN